VIPVRLLALGAVAVILLALMLKDKFKA